MREVTRRVLGVDWEGNQIRINNKMKETGGELREGRVLHIHASHYAFLYKRSLPETRGVFVTRANGLASMFPRNVSKYSATRNGGNNVQKPAAAFLTPHPYAGGSMPSGTLTPRNGYALTPSPSPYAGESTPAWNPYSKTPTSSPYLGGITPAWNSSPSRSTLLNHSVLGDLASTPEREMDLCEDPYGRLSLFMIKLCS